MVNSQSKEKFWNVPNLITLTRVALTPIFAWMLLRNRAFGALLIIFLAGLSDVVDGMAARKWHQRTKAGILIDPLADKILLSTAYILLAVPSLGFTYAIPLWLTAVVIARDGIILSGGLAIYLIRGRREFPPSLLGKMSTIMQVATAFWVVLSNYVWVSDWGKISSLAGITSPSVLEAFYKATLILTAVSGAHYVYNGARLTFFPHFRLVRVPSYKTSVRVLRALPVCPKPRSIGLQNIPRGEPVIYVYNHVTRRVEPVWLAVAAPYKPGVRFFVDIKVTRPEIFDDTQTDVRNSLFSTGLQEKWGRHSLRQKILETGSRLVTLYVMAAMKRYNFIPVYVHDPWSPEEEARKRRINREAFKMCVNCLENGIPVAIAPSGGYTHRGAKRSSVPTILPSLAEALRKRGKTLNIIPSIVKERPAVGHGTYKTYVADRILPYRLFRLLLDRLKIKRYDRPRLTVEFLPPLTYPHSDSGKEEKILFVQNLQKIMLDVLHRD
jgi:cardiolipin synthase (CMP-forming)